MKTIYPKLLLIFLLTATSSTYVLGQLFEWRGPGRTGIYNETGLLKKWPDAGPKLAWETIYQAWRYTNGVPDKVRLSWLPKIFFES